MKKLSRLSTGWIWRQNGGETIAVLADGFLCHLVPDRSLNFGTPVDVIVHQLHPRRRDVCYGEVVASRPLPDLTHGEDRPPALLDTANLTTENREPATWRAGAVRSWAVSYALDRIGYTPVFVSDPGHLLTCYGHSLSAAAYARVRGVMARERGWRWVCVDDGLAVRDRADRELLRRAEACPSAIIVSRDKFRYLAPSAGKERVHAPKFTSERVILPKLGLAEDLPIPLFRALLAAR